MELKVIKKTIYEIDEYDFNEFVMKKYGGNFEFVAQHEANNDSQYSFNARKKTTKDSSYLLSIKEDIRKGAYGMHSVYAVFECLLEDGHIDEGEYVIEVCW